MKPDDLALADRLEPAGFTLMIRGGEFQASFVAFERTSVEDDPPRYRRQGSTTSDDEVDDLFSAEWFVRGDVKWDGCANFEFNEEAQMFHTCGRRSMEEHSAVLLRAFDECASRIAKFDRGVAR